MSSVQELTSRVEREAPLVKSVVDEISKVMVGQKILVERLLMALLADGHILVEGVPGLAKTTAALALAEVMTATFGRIQFTPDLLPSDLVGTEIYSPREESFSVKQGPVFAHIILADEINRAPAKVQSALLEAMQEKQVTIGEKSYALPAPFLVMATQNPIEQEGTYPLPEAQLDRFMMKVKITYPTRDEEMLVMKRLTEKKSKKVSLTKLLTPEKILELRSLIEDIFVDEKLFGYVADLIFATRSPEKFGIKELKSYIEIGAGPRASINLIKTAKAHAFLQGRGFVTPQDIKIMALDVLRHRVGITYEAEAEGMESDDILIKILDKIDVP